MVIYSTYMKDEGINLVRKKKNKFSELFLKKNRIYSTAEFEKQFTSCYSKYIQSE